MQLSGTRRLLFATIVALASAATLASTDWPGFRGPDHTGAVPDPGLFREGATALEIAWKRPLGSGYSAIAVVDGRVMTMFADGDADYLAAFDTASGDELWRYRIGETYSGHDGSHDGPISTPLVSGDRVYALGPRGHLFALDAGDGREIWKTHLVDDHGGRKPHYGFTTAPVMAAGTLVVQIGGEGERAVAGFDPADGTLRWALGEDEIGYQSPVVVDIGGKRQVVAAGKTFLWGIDAASGKALWTYEHGGDERAMGGHTIVPLPAGEGRLFLMNKIDSSAMLSVKAAGDGFEVAELWTTNGIKQSYVPPVYHDGYIYGMANRIFSCIDAATGELAWRSREPGDGFPTLVGDRLVVITKPGTLHIAQASPDGYREEARIELFDDHSWSEVAVAGGHIFARSMAELARIDPIGAGGGETGDGDLRGSWMAETRFGAFLERLETVADRKAAVDAWMAEHPRLPLIEEGGVVHFLYRGDARDVGIVGDMIGYRREDPMTRVAGTDLFYYSTRLEPDAAVSYGFIPDYAEEAVADPLNPETASGLFGDVSWLAMPAWRPAGYLDEADPARRGTMETFEWESAIREGQKRKAEVYLPVGYADGDARYPVVYVHGGGDALENGLMRNALDHLLGDEVAPLIAVFVIPDEENPGGDLGDAEGYAKMLVEELVPAIDERYRTRADATWRASVGSGRGANAALSTALAHPDVFRKVGSQSANMMTGEQYGEMLPDGAPMVIYLEWGTYHLRSPHEAWDMGRGNRELWNMLRERGYRPAGGEVPEGFGWRCWRNRTGEMLSTLFPVRVMTAEVRR